MVLCFGHPLSVSAISLGEVHDFSDVPAFQSTGLPGGCAGCHVPHGSIDIKLWSRDLTPDPLILNDLCLDCHDGSGPAWAGTPQNVSNVVSSRHDFYPDPIAPKGSCSACHDIHLPAPNTLAYEGTFFTSAYLWVRSLEEELNGPVNTEFYQTRALGITSVFDKANYLIGSTVLCYDCHSGNAGANGPGDIAWVL
jgi:hypothetical protein